MLSVSAAAPKPGNWCGVNEGLALARAAMDAGRYEEACARIHEVLEFAPMEASGWHLLGKALQAMGKHAQALDCFAHAAKLYKSLQSPGEDVPASVHLAKLLWQQGEQQAARAMLERLIQQRGAGDEQLFALKRAWKEA